MRLYSLYLTDELKRGLEVLKQRDDISESAAVRRAVAEFLKRRGIAIQTKKKGGKAQKIRR